MSDSTENPNEVAIKCVVVGDNNVGKTRLICSRAYNEEAPNNRCNTSTSHVPTVWAIDQYRNNKQVLDNARCVVDGTIVSLRLWDTFGDHHKNRRFAYGKADVVVICFSICDEKSLNQVTKFWLPEVRKHNKSTPVLLVACKVDLRFAEVREKIKCKGTLSKTIKKSDIIFPEQCRAVAMDMNCPYYESSVLLGYGVNDVFENACRAALLYRRNLYFWNTSLKRIQRLTLQIPLEPPQPKPPVISTPYPPKQNKLLQMYRENVLTDVVVLCENERIHAHKVVLAASSETFADVFTSAVLPRNNEAFLLTISKFGNTVESYKPKEVEFCGQDSDKRDVFQTKLSKDVGKILIEFCYTGDLPQTNLELLTSLIVSGQKFCIPELVTIAANQINSVNFDSGFLDRRTRNIKKMFVDDDLFADVVFHLDDGAIRGHKVLLSSGCDVMMAMFAGRFIESENKEVDLPDTTCESFHSILEFIYTNQLPYMDRCSTVNDIIKLANRLCLPELISRLCSIVIGIIESEEERYLDKLAITKLCDDVVMMLQISELHNAPELKQWCLYFLSVHYNDACRNIPKIMKGLPTHILTYLEEHRWPPVWFIKQRDVYEKSLHQRKEQIGRKSRK